MPRPEPPLLALEGVDRRYPNGVLALQGVTLAVQRGEFVSLLGPSGCGKSSVLRLMAGLDEPSAGRLARPGDDIGFVFQEPTLMPWATIEANVALPLRLAQRPPAETAAAVAAALASVGLADFARAVPRELSGGMKMRVSIARALVTRPALLLLDEPFAALDEMARFRLNEALLALWQAQGFTAVFVTHSVYEAVFLSQRVVVMSARPGRIAAEIAVDAAYPRDAAFRATSAFSAHCSRVSEALQALHDGTAATPHG